jgi:hypothetical protein
MSVMVKQNEKQKLTLLEKLQKCTLSWEIYKTFIRQIFHQLLIRCFCNDGENWNIISPLMEYFGLEECVVWGSGLVCSEKKLEELKA